jgi:hypothetical protein
VRDQDALLPVSHGERRPLADLGDDGGPVGPGNEHKSGGSVELDRQDLAVACVELALQLPRAHAPDLHRAVAVPAATNWPSGEYASASTDSPASRRCRIRAPPGTSQIVGAPVAVPPTSRVPVEGQAADARPAEGQKDVHVCASNTRMSPPLSRRASDCRR